MLAEHMSAARLAEVLIPRDQFHPYPTIADRAFWDGLPADLRQAVIASGEAELAKPWECLPATRYLDFHRDGNRSRFEHLLFLRRDRLCRLLFAECYEGKGRFIDEIVNGVWAMCEESSWCLPAHIGMQKSGTGLPEVDHPVVDLFAAEAGAFLAWIHYLLGDRLDAVSPLIRPRIELEVRNRVCDPAFEYDHWWWLGFGEHAVNNWNPWIHSNCLACYLLLEDDLQHRVDALIRIFRSLDKFVGVYHADGGCDEGPGYWNRAGASLFECLDLLYLATGGAYNLFDQPLIANMGRYIYRVHIASEWVVDFADAHALIQPDGQLIYRFGQRIGDQEMCDFGAWCCQQYGAGKLRRIEHGRHLADLVALRDIPTTPVAPPLLRDVFMDGLEVMIARDQQGATDGFFVAAKGGHNAESHNHNDIGHYVVYRDGKPLLVDAGVGVYSRKTFSPQRYEIWTMQSQYHNLPTINGFQQLPGGDHRAAAVAYECSDAQATMALDIAKAYPPEAGVTSWRRQVTLVRGREVRIDDAWSLTAVTGPLTLNLLTAATATREATGVIRLAARALPGDRASAAGAIVVPAGWEAVCERVAIEDELLSATWGDHLTRIVLTCAKPPLSGSCSVSIRA